MKPSLLVSLCLPFRKVSPESCEIWLQKRNEDGPLNGTWEFPGGKIEADESPPVTGARELLEETSLEVSWEKLVSFKTYRHEYSDRHVLLFVHLLYFSTQSEYQRALNEEGWKSFEYGEPLSSEWAQNIPAANREILKDLGDYLKGNADQVTWRNLWQQLSC